jgi:hypothetical protein
MTPEHLKKVELDGLKNICCTGCLDNTCAGIYSGESINIKLKAFLDNQHKAHQAEIRRIETELRKLEEIAENEMLTINGEHCTCIGHAIWLLFEATDEERERYWGNRDSATNRE